MNHHDLLRSLATTFDLDAARLAAVLALGGEPASPEEVASLLGEANRPVSDALLGQLLDGLIADRRGAPSEPRPATPARLTNNVVLKKLRIALSLQEADVLAALKAGGHPLTPRELGALSRSPDNKRYRACSDEVLAAFLVGLRAR